MGLITAIINGLAVFVMQVRFMCTRMCVCVRVCVCVCVCVSVCVSVCVMDCTRILFKGKRDEDGLCIMCNVKMFRYKWIGLWGLVPVCDMRYKFSIILGSVSF